MSDRKTKLLQFRVTPGFHAWFNESKKRNDGVKNMHDFLIYLAMKEGYNPTESDFPHGTSLTLIKSALNAK